MPVKGDNQEKRTAEDAIEHHGVDALYSLSNYHEDVRVIVDKDVDVFGEYGEVTGKTTLITLLEQYNINIDGEFLIGTETFKVDETDKDGDGWMQTVSVVKQ